MFSNKAQAGLEYLMTYGWALLMIATVVGVLVFLVGSPVQQVQFSSSQPTKLLLKSSAVDATTATAVLQNITGGQMQITGIASTGSTLTNCTIDTKGAAQLPITINAGATMLFECGYSGTPNGTITIAYKNFAGIAQTAGITAGGGTGGTTVPPATCPNGTLDAGEVCDGANLGDMAGKPNISCRSDCLAYNVTGCTTLDKAHNFYVPQSQTINTNREECILITASNVSLACETGASLHIGSAGWSGVVVSGSNASISGCRIFFSGVSQTGIRLNSSSPHVSGCSFESEAGTYQNGIDAGDITSNPEITGNTFSMGDWASNGIYLYAVGGTATISNNIFSPAPDCDVTIEESTVSGSGNTNCGKCRDTPADGLSCYNIQCDGEGQGKPGGDYGNNCCQDC